MPPQFIERNDVFMHAILVGAISGTIVAVLLTVGGELLPSLKNTLKEWYGHHWVGKGIWTAIAFALSSLGYAAISPLPSEQRTVRLVVFLAGALVAGAAAITLFFVYEFMVSA